ncbi:MAG TPA: dihydropteroate synthase [Miltoncostaeaceae bacterium]|nr:dihydropteroate synthase [Miltoncostaeaceae bacterium]
MTAGLGRPDERRPPPERPIARSESAAWIHARGVLDCSRGRLVGIVNANPDSFSDAGAHAGTDAAVEHGRRLAGLGADVVEVGGESLRFAPASPPEVEIGRVVPVIERLAAELDVPVAVDTYKPAVAAAAIAAGAAILNDPTGLRDPEMASVAAGAEVGVVAAHFFGPPKVRPGSFPDVDVPAVVADWARERVGWATARGIAPERLVIDPGIGLGKSPPQDLDLMRRLDAVVAAGRPVLVPISNKKVLGAITGAAAADRLAETTAALAWCRARGATLFRVHDVRFARGALEVAEALVTGRPERWHDVEK